MSDPVGPVFAGGFEEFVIEDEAGGGGIHCFSCRIATTTPYSVSASLPFFITFRKKSGSPATLPTTTSNSGISVSGARFFRRNAQH